MNTSALFALGFLLISSLAQGQVKSNTESQATADTIPFELTEHNTISIQAIINGTDTVQLMFHSAANDVTIISDALTKVPSISWDHESNVQSWGGETEARFSINNSLQIGSARWDRLAIWENKNSGPSTDGKFGLNLFAGQVIELDFVNRILVIHSCLPIRASEFHKVPLFYKNELMFIEGISKIGGQEYPRKFLIHSGYGGSILFDDAFAEESQLGKHIEITSQQELKDSYGNSILTKKGTLPEITFGSESYKDVTVGFFEGSIGRQTMSVLGSDLLKRFHWIIDASREHAYLKAN